MSTVFYVQSGLSGTTEEVEGPFTAKQLRELAQSGVIKRVTLISRDKQKWVAAERVQGLTFPKVVTKQTDSQYFYSRNGQPHGPVCYGELVGLSKDGTLTSATLVWTDPWPEWRPAGVLAGLFDAIVTVPPPFPSPSRPLAPPLPETVGPQVTPVAASSVPTREPAKDVKPDDSNNIESIVGFVISLVLLLRWLSTFW